MLVRRTTVDRERMAVISDVHGNIWALERVLEDVRRRGIEGVVNLGDSVYGSLDARGTADLLMEANIPSISGNQDRLVTGQLDDAHLGWLEGLSATRIVGDVLFCHGTPRSDETYMLESVTERGVFLNGDAAILARLSGVEQGVVLCGHSHVPRTVRVSYGRLVVNPGSVGLPAYTDGSPYPHAMETGSPHARYAVLSDGPCGWVVEHVLVPYAWDEAAAVTRRNGREDRAHWLETGRGDLAST